MIINLFYYNSVLYVLRLPLSLAFYYVFVFGYNLIYMENFTNDCYLHIQFNIINEVGDKYASINKNEKPLGEQQQNLQQAGE